MGGDGIDEDDDHGVDDTERKNDKENRTEVNDTDKKTTRNAVHEKFIAPKIELLISSTLICLSLSRSTAGHKCNLKDKYPIP